MFTVTRFATEQETNCGARRAASRVLTRFFTSELRCEISFTNLLSIVVIDMASLEQFEFPQSVRRALFGNLSESQRASFTTVLNTGIEMAGTDDRDMSFQALVNREVQDILRTLLTQLAGGKCVAMQSRNSTEKRELVGV